VRRVRVLGGREVPVPPRCGLVDGYSVHAGVWVAGRDREALERVCRYVLRPPLAKGRLEEQVDGTVVLHLRRSWADGTTALRFSKAELCERLIARIPPPRANQVLYHGVLAAHAAWRSEVVPPAEEVARRRAARGSWQASKLARPERCSASSRWWPWAELLWRVFGVQGWACPRCGERMRLRAVVLHPPATTRVMRTMASAVRLPPVRGSPVARGAGG